MKAHLATLLLIALLAASTTPLRAQNGVPDPFPLVPYVTVPDRAQGPFKPAATVDPRFPLRVQMLSGDWKYGGNHEYQGSGTMRLFGQPVQQLAYHYRCANSFVNLGATYQARWVKPGEKLEILMSKPRSHHTVGCRLSTRS